MSFLTLNLVSLVASPKNTLWKYDVYHDAYCISKKTSLEYKPSLQYFIPNIYISTMITYFPWCCWALLWFRESNMILRYKKSCARRFRTMKGASVLAFFWYMTFPSEVMPGCVWDDTVSDPTVECKLRILDFPEFLNQRKQNWCCENSDLPFQFWLFSMVSLKNFLEPAIFCHLAVLIFAV